MNSLIARTGLRLNKTSCTRPSLVTGPSASWRLPSDCRAASTTRPRAKPTRKPDDQKPKKKLFQPPSRPAWLSSRPINEEITHRYVQLIDPVSQKLGDAVTLSSLLASIDEEKEFIELVRDEPPLVKILNRSEAWQAYKEQRKRIKTNVEPETKEIQMTWAADEGDYRRKLDKVRKELEKGNRVDLVFASRRGQIYPSKPQMVEKLNQARDQLTDVAVERKPFETQRIIGILFLEPRTQ